MPTIRQYLSKENARLLIFGLVLQLISRGSSLFSLTFNIDDIIFWSREYSYSTLLPTAIRDGRFTNPFLGEIENLLGINPPLAFTISTLLFMVCISISAIAVCYIWGIQKNHGASLIIVGFITLHPYLTDFYTWRIATFNGGLPFVFTAISLLWGARSNKVLPLAIILIALSFGIHQIPLAFYVTTLIGAALFIYLRHFGVIVRCDSTETDSKVEVIHLVRMAFVLGMGTIIYVILAKLYISQGGIPTLSRDKIILFEKPLLVLSRIFELFSLFYENDQLITGVNRLFFLGLLTISVVSIWCKSSGFFQASKLVLAMLLILVMFALASIGLAIVSAAWIPVYRNIFSISLIWSAVAAIAYLTATDSFRNITLTLVGVLFIAFIAKDNEMLTDQMRANLRDTSMMNRIVGDIEKLPEFKTIHSLVFVGTTPTSLRGLKSAADLSDGWNSYGTTLSLFAIPWNGYLVQFFNEVTGYQLNQVDFEKHPLPKNACANLSWPQAGAVFSSGSIAIVCLGDSNEITFGPLDARH